MLKLRKAVRDSRRTLFTLIGATLAGTAAGAGALHLLHRYGYHIGLDLRQYRPPPESGPPPTPAEYNELEPGRGRAAEHPLKIPRKGWTDSLWRTGIRFFGDRVSFVSVGITFFLLLSLFPTLAAFVTLYGLFLDPADAWEHLRFLYSVLPAGVAEFIGGEMQRLANNSADELTFTLIWTLLLSLWLANNGVKSLFHGINVAYHETESRNPLIYNLITMGFTVGALLSVLLVTGLVIVVPLVLGVLGLPDEWLILQLLRWPVLLIFYIGALTLVYRYGPNRRPARLRWLMTGAVFAAVTSLTVSALFSWYLQTFVRTASYGPLAAMMGFLLWTWITVQIVLVGAEINAEVEHQTAVDTTVGQERIMGERSASMADTLGLKRGDLNAVKEALRYVEAIGQRFRRIGGSSECDSGDVADSDVDSHA